MYTNFYGTNLEPSVIFTTISLLGMWSLPSRMSRYSENALYDASHVYHDAHSVQVCVLIENHPLASLWSVSTTSCPSTKWMRRLCTRTSPTPEMECHWNTSIATIKLRPTAATMSTIHPSLSRMDPSLGEVVTMFFVTSTSRYTCSCWVLMAVDQEGISGGGDWSCWQW